MPEAARQEALRRAVDRLGLEILERELKSPRALIEAWMRGHATMPDRKFMLLADLMDRNDLSSE